MLPISLLEEFLRWKNQHDEGSGMCRPYIRILLPQLPILELIKTAHDQLSEEMMPKSIKLKLQRFIRKLVHEQNV